MLYHYTLWVRHYNRAHDHDGAAKVAKDGDIQTCDNEIQINYAYGIDIDIYI